MNSKKKKQLGGIGIITLFLVSILPSVMFNLTESPEIDMNLVGIDKVDEISKIEDNLNLDDLKSSALPAILGTPSVYSTRFLELFEDIQTKGYLSSEGIPYHSIETFMVEAPDYGHLTTSESFSFLVWLGAQYGQMTGDWSHYKSAWDLTEQYIIPQQGLDQMGAGYNPNSPAQYAPEEALPSDYPNAGQPSFPTGIDPIAAELKSTYNSDGVYQMHWLLDVDNWYKYGKRGDGISRASYINTYQRGPQESVWETVPHPSWEDFSFGSTEGFGPIFADFGTPSKQWKYTSASDADARQVQASYWAKKWAAEQGSVADISAYTSKASKMGDYLRYTQYDKYFKPIGIQGGTTVGTGENSNTGLLTWYTSWGGAMDDAWGFRIGGAHAHQGYQNVLAAYALANEPGIIPISPNGKTAWERSENRQIELYQYLQSAEGGIAGGVTNSWEGAYQAYPAGSSTFYDMIYDSQPVYHDPPSNNWFGMQAWGMERVVEHFLETNDPRTRDVTTKWVDWAVSQVQLPADGTYAIPSTLTWTGQPDTWTGVPTGNTGLHVSVKDWGQDIGITACLSKALLKYSAAIKKWDGIAHEASLNTAKELLDRMWTLYRDDKGVAVPEERGDYSRLDDEVYIPLGFTGTNGQGAILQNGMTFLDMRPDYKLDPDYNKIRTAIDAGQKPKMTYHRFWAQADLALAYAAMHMYFPMEDDGLAPAAPTGLVSTEVGSKIVVLNWNDNTEADISSYKIYRSLSSNVQPISANFVGSSSTSTFSDSGLNPETMYYYVVTAVDIFNYESLPSSVLSVTTTIAGPPPAAPTGLISNGVTTSSISLDWNDNSELDIDNYVVYRSISPSVSLIIGNKIATVSTSQYLDEGLTDNTMYYYVVVAVNTNGDSSAASLELSATTNEIIAPEVLLRLQYQCAETSTSSSQIKPWMNLYNDDSKSIPLSDVSIRYWFTSEVSLANMVCDIDYAQIGSSNIETTFGTKGEFDYTEIGFKLGTPSLDAGANTGQIQNRIHSSGYENLNQANDYSFDSTVSVFKDSTLITAYYQGKLVWGVEPGSIGGPVAPVLNSPNDISYVIGETGNLISWTATDDNPTTYTITRDGTAMESGTWTSGGAISISVDGLAEGTYLYEITVSDGDSLSKSDGVNVIVNAVQDTTPPAAPTGLTVSSTGTTSISLGWTANSESDLLGYKVYRSTTSGFTPSAANLVASPATNTYADSGLTAATTYYYKVTAVDTSNNEGVSSVQASATTDISQDTTPPVAPTGLIATTTGTTSISLDWMDNSELDLQQYNVYRSITPGFTPSAANLIASPTTSTYADSGLTADTTYYYKVTAVDTSNNEGPSSTQASAKTNAESSTTIITAPFTQDGAGEFTWKIAEIPSYINSWNLQSLTINGVDFTNKWTPSLLLPPKVDGYYTIHYVANFGWSHLEIK